MKEKEREREHEIVIESLCRTGSRTVASLFSRVSPGYLKSIIRTAKRNVINKSRKIQGTNRFFRIANYAEIWVEGQ